SFLLGNLQYGPRICFSLLALSVLLCFRTNFIVHWIFVQFLHVWLNCCLSSVMYCVLCDLLSCCLKKNHFHI
uniref:Uncharacterized protein n=1 Tax=Aegilops tauschii subsp. strangulata TaxID=200361 RepID=A0A453H1Y1_AEGTS